MPGAPAVRGVTPRLFSRLWRRLNRPLPGWRTAAAGRRVALPHWRVDRSTWRRHCSAGTRPVAGLPAASVWHVGPRCPFATSAPWCGPVALLIGVPVLSRSQKGYAARSALPGVDLAALAQGATPAAVAPCQRVVRRLHWARPYAVALAPSGRGWPSLVLPPLWLVVARLPGPPAGAAHGALAPHCCGLTGSWPQTAPMGLTPTLCPCRCATPARPPPCPPLTRCREVATDNR